MRYVQHKVGQKLHLAYEIEGGLTHPVCGRAFSNYRASFNVPLGNACKCCLKRVNSRAFEPKKFIKKYYE